MMLLRCSRMVAVVVLEGRSGDVGIVMRLLWMCSQAAVDM